MARLPISPSQVVRYIADGGNASAERRQSERGAQAKPRSPEIVVVYSVCIHIYIYIYIYIVYIWL